MPSADSHASAVRPTIPAMRALLYIASVLVLLMGVTLYFLSESTEQNFAWTIAVPLTAAFLGGGYLTSFLLEFLSARERLWDRSRIAVPAVLTFTALTLIVTLVHADRFHFNAPQLLTVAGTWIWAIVYAVVPAAMAITLYRQIKAPGREPARIAPPADWVRGLQFLQGVIMIGLGSGLFLAPATFAPMWPWELTPLTSRAIGAWLIGLGIAAFHAGLENDLVRLRPLMIGCVVYPLLQYGALLRYPGAAGLNWSALNTWLYVSFLFSLLVVGVYGVIQASRLAKQQPARHALAGTD